MREEGADGNAADQESGEDKRSTVGMTMRLFARPRFSAARVGASRRLHQLRGLPEYAPAAPPANAEDRRRLRRDSIRGDRGSVCVLHPVRGSVSRKTEDDESTRRHGGVRRVAHGSRTPVLRSIAAAAGSSLDPGTGDCGLWISSAAASAMVLGAPLALFLSCL